MKKALYTKLLQIGDDVGVFLARSHNRSQSPSQIGFRTFQKQLFLAMEQTMGFLGLTTIFNKKYLFNLSNF